MMNKTLKTLAALLCYPTPELCAAGAELRAALRGERRLSPRRREAVEILIGQLQQRDIYHLQERYHLLFDRGRALSLHLFEHVHGESRDRGQAMVDLLALYQRHGMWLTARELPDYLPLFVEFVSTRPADEARELLSRPLHIIAALGTRLAHRDSPYAAVFQALEELAGGKPEHHQAHELAAAEDDAADPRTLDALWQEPAVSFGPAAALAAAGGHGGGVPGSSCAPRATPRGGAGESS